MWTACYTRMCRFMGRTGFTRGAIGWRALAASRQWSGGDLNLGPEKSGRLRQGARLRVFSSGGQPVNVQKMTGFVNQVEFADGKVWVPTRKSLQDPALLKAVAPSAE